LVRYLKLIGILKMGKSKISQQTVNSNSNRSKVHQQMYWTY
jgi:hypothetical protein